MILGKRSLVLWMVTALLLLASPLLVQAQDSFEITDNDWTYRQEGLDKIRFTHDFGYSYFYDAEGNDHLYQNSWWYRTSGDTREYGFSNLTSVSSNGNTAHLTYEEVGAGGGDNPVLRFDITYTLIGINATQAYLQTNWSLTNLTSSVLPVSLFTYSDFDVDLDSGDDSAQLEFFGPSAGYIKAWDEGSPTIFNIIASGSGLSSWEIAPWSNTLDILTDDSISELSSASSPLGPGEMTGAFQYSFNLTDSQIVSGSLIQGVNAVPEPSSAAGLLIGLAGLSRVRRFKRR